LKDLYLVTPDGRVLALQKSEWILEPPPKLHLYQEVCPVQPLVVSSLAPREFCRFMTDTQRPIHVPKIFFAELRLGELAVHPEKGSARDLPYHSIMHLRDCLMSLKESARKDTKTVDRIPPQEFPYRMVESGFFIGDQESIYYYPFPSELELEEKYHLWWKSATQ